MVIYLGVHDHLRIQAKLNVRRDALHAAADGHVQSFIDDLMRGHRNGLQARGAVPAHGQTGNRGGQPGPDERDTRDVVALLPKWLAATNDHFFDFRRVQLRRFAQQVLDAMRRQVVGPGHIERAAKRFCQGGTRASNDYGFSHK